VRSDAIDVVYEGIDLERFRPVDDRGRIRELLGLAPDAFVLIAPGRLDPAKDLEGVLRTFALVMRQAPQALLLVAGAASSHTTIAAGERYRTSLLELSRALGVSGSVEWLGHRRDMPELYSASDAVLLFGSIPEPFGLVTCEALACGRPMITPRQGGSVEILTDEFSRFMFSPGAYDEASRIILSMRHLSTRDPGFAGRARAHLAGRFDLRRMGERMEEVLTSAVAAGHTRRGPGLSTFKHSPSMSAG
jgi:glycosyltransferase involved in cell wall biosynthesis